MAAAAAAAGSALTSVAARLKKVQPTSVAMACASVVLPQPGGPCSRMPRGGSTPSLHPAPPPAARSPRVTSGERNTHHHTTGSPLCTGCAAQRSRPTLGTGSLPLPR